MKRGRAQVRAHGQGSAYAAPLSLSSIGALSSAEMDGAGKLTKPTPVRRASLQSFE
jgi:hypothetical protein